MKYAMYSFFFFFKFTWNSTFLTCLFASSCRWINTFEFNQAVKVATKMASLGECFTSLDLDSLLAFSDVVKPGKGAVYVSVHLLPGFDVEDRITLGYFSDQDPLFEL